MEQGSKKQGTNWQFIGKVIFLAVITIGAGSVAAHTSIGYHPTFWMVQFSMEFIRILMVMYNIQIRKISERKANVALTLSIVVTVLMGFMHYFASRELVEGEYVIHWVELMALETVNILVVAAEWVVSVVIAGKQDGNLLEVIRRKFELSQVFDIIDTEYKEVINWIEAQKKGFDQQLEDLKKQIQKAEADHGLQIQEISSSLKHEQETTVKLREANELLSQQLDFFEKLLAGFIEMDDQLVVSQLDNVPELYAEKLTPLWHVWRELQAGHIVSDKRVPLGNDFKNLYWVPCSGNGKPGTCAPFLVPKAKEKFNCPSCGKEHTKASIYPVAPAPAGEMIRIK